MTRQEAIEAGNKTYQGKPCKNCGNTEKYVSSYGCVICCSTRNDAEYIKEYSKSEKAKQRSKRYMASYTKLTENNKKWRSKPTTKEKIKKYYEDNKDMWLRSNVKKYGITIEYYYQLLEDQNNSCAICGAHESAFSRRLHIDHCHTTGVVRGLLCHNCNAGIGHFKEDKDIMIKAMEYLKC